LSPRGEELRLAGRRRIDLHDLVEQGRDVLDPFGERMAVFTPMTRPCMSKSGPPELPRLMAASVWMKSS
jgi:hypothetical protein